MQGDVSERLKVPHLKWGVGANILLPWVQIPPSPQNWYGSINRRETAKGSLDKLSPVRVNPYKPKLLETPEMGLSTMSLALYRFNL